VFLIRIPPIRLSTKRCAIAVTVNTPLIAMLFGLFANALYAAPSVVAPTVYVLRLACGYRSADGAENVPVPSHVLLPTRSGRQALLIVEERGDDVVLLREGEGTQQAHDLAPSGWAYQPVWLSELGASWRIESASGAAIVKLNLGVFCGDSASPLRQVDTLRAMQRAAGYLADGVSAAHSAEQRNADAGQALRLLDSVAAATRDVRDTAWPWLAPMALQSAAFLHGRNGEPELSSEKQIEAVALWRRNGDSFRALLGTHRLAQQARRQGRLDEAERLLKEVIQGLDAEHPSNLRGLAMTDLCLVLRGQRRLHEAESCYERAIALHRKRGDQSEQAMTLANRANLQLVMGKFGAAEADANAGLNLARAINARRANWTALMVLGGIERARAQTESAVRLYLEAATIAVGLSDQNQLANVQLQLAQTWYLSGDYPRALDFAQAAINAYREGAYWARASEAMLLLSSIHRSRGDIRAAIVSVVEARELLQQHSMTDGLTEVWLALAECHVDSGDWDAATAALAQLPTVSSASLYAMRMRRALLSARLGIARGQWKAALQQVRAVEGEAERSGDPLFAFDAIVVGAAAMKAAGRLHDAEQAYAKGVSAALRLAQAQSYPVYRALYVARAENALGAYLEVSQQRSHSPQSVVERLKLFDRLRAVTSAVVSPAAGAATDTELIAAQAELNEALRTRWLEAPDATQPAASATQLATLLARVESRYASGHQNAASVVPVALPMALPAGSGTLALMVGEHKVFLWTQINRRIVETVADSAQKVRVEAAALSALLRTSRSNLAQIETLTLALRTTLNLGPASASETKQWYVVADSALAGVPMTLLLGSDPEPKAVVQLASLGGMQTSQAAFASPGCCQGLGLLAFADPAAGAASPTGKLRAGGLSRLPGSRREVQAVELAWSPASVRVYLGHAFTAAAVLAALRTPDSIVHIATHGLKDAQTVGFNALLVVDDNDGATLRVLGWNEILLNPSAAQMVVLGACDVGEGAIVEGGRSVGLAQAFLNAGVRHVVASLWRVDDEASISLMRAFYQSLARGASPPRALALAQAAMRSDARYRHPFYWAGIGVYQ
jgi:CHAT domain-containing protein